MTVNPDLATLMRVIEDQQDKMPEGEYLAAMNALGALHRVAPAPAPVPPVALAAAAANRAPIGPIPSGRPPSYSASAPLFGGGGANPNSYSNLIAMMGQYGYNTWTRVARMIPERRQMTAVEWVALTQEEQNTLNRAATLKIVESYEITYRNPVPSVCPFVARHAVGAWSYGAEHSTWTCVCGYHGKSKNWKRHEESERHQDWAQHRIVPRRTIETMKTRIAQDEQGELLRFNQPLTGGIRYYQVTQERNEWTHPESYLGIHREKNGNGSWFVHQREDWPHQFVN
jgi:hypothetical protein